MDSTKWGRIGDAKLCVPNVFFSPRNKITSVLIRLFKIIRGEPYHK